MEALARRTNPASPPVLAVAGLEIDAPRHQALRGRRFLRLSNKEFAVLVVLARRAGIVVSAQDLLEKAWDEHADLFTNTVRMTVMTLRRKLGDQPIIHMVPGIGYRMEQ